MDGVSFAASEVELDCMDPAADVFRTGNVVDDLLLPNDHKLGALSGTSLKVTMISAGIPTIFVNAEDMIGFLCQMEIFGPSVYKTMYGSDPI